MPEATPRNIVCAGGLDQLTPPLTIDEGKVLGALNFWAKPKGGYERCYGYERFSGQLAPSGGSYWILPFDAGAVEITAGTSVYGLTSGAIGFVAEVNVDSGDWATSDAAGTLVLTYVEGTFADNEELIPGLSRQHGTWTPSGGSSVANDPLDIAVSGEETTIRVAGTGTPYVSSSIGVSGVFTIKFGTTILRLQKSSGSELAYMLVGSSAGASDYGLAVENASAAEPQVISGSFTSSFAAHHVSLFVNSVTFGDTAVFGASGFGQVLATAAGTATHRGEATTAADLATLSQVREYLRSRIQPSPALPPESDYDPPFKGVFAINGQFYAVGRSSGGAMQVYSASAAAGWAALEAPGRYVRFTAGTAAFNEGATLTDGTATATIRRVVVVSGDWSGGNAVGYMTINNVSGTFGTSAAISDNGTTPGAATMSGTDGTDAITMREPLGMLEIEVHNFLSTTAGSSERAYWVDGYNNLFEFDGSNILPVKTDGTNFDNTPSADAPTHVIAHASQLFVGFSNGLVRHSSIGAPTDFRTLISAGERGLGDAVTGFSRLEGGTLAMLTRNNVFILRGRIEDDFVQETYGEKVGAIENTVQRLPFTMFLDDQGITSLAAVQEFGDFASGSLSDGVRDFLVARKDRVTCAIVSRTHSQYRLFFDDGTWLALSFQGRQPVGFMPLQYDTVVKRAYACLDAEGNERLMFIGTNGGVYEMDKGTSFDGAAIESYLRFPYWHMGRPSQNKHFRRTFLTVDAASALTLSHLTQFDYGSEEAPTSPMLDTSVAAGWELAREIVGGAGAWDETTWDSAVFDGESRKRISVDTEGDGENMGLYLYNSSAMVEPFTIYDMTVRFDWRGARRHG